MEFCGGGELRWASLWKKAWCDRLADRSPEPRGKAGLTWYLSEPEQWVLRSKTIPVACCTGSSLPLFSDHGRNGAFVLGTGFWPGTRFSPPPSYLSVRGDEGGNDKVAGGLALTQGARVTLMPDEVVRSEPQGSVRYS